MGAIVLLCALGTIVSLLSPMCTLIEVEMKDSRFVGIPLFIVGLVGYGMILLSTSSQPAMWVVMPLLAAFTIYLIVKAMKLRLLCTLCIAAWIINFSIVYIWARSLLV